ncbi:MAG: hypothetical protein HY818_10605 [Acetobacterium woodii]|nr:hypothetical protein [Acetobacterium woodii]
MSEQEQKLYLKINQTKLKEIQEKLSRAAELAEELGAALDSIKKFEGLFEA